MCRNGRNDTEREGQNRRQINCPRARAVKVTRGTEPTHSAEAPGPTRHVLPAVIQLLNLTQFFAAPWTAACQVSLSFRVAGSFPVYLLLSSAHPSACTEVQPGNPVRKCTVLRRLNTPGQLSATVCMLGGQGVEALF